jgi:hypothetical protein
MAAVRCALCAVALYVRWDFTQHQQLAPFLRDIIRRILGGFYNLLLRTQLGSGRACVDRMYRAFYIA